MSITNFNFFQHIVKQGKSVYTEVSTKKNGGIFRGKPILRFPWKGDPGIKF